MSKSPKVTIKKSQNDIIKTAVGSYLRRRNYIDVTERFKKSELVLSQSPEEMVLQVAVEKSASSLNSALYNTVVKDEAQAEQQFSRLQAWVATLGDEENRNEISPLLLPILCHMYLDFLVIGIRLPHFKSIKESLVAEIQPSVSQRQLLSLSDELHNIATTDDISTIPKVKMFRSGKYEVNISPKAFSALRKYIVDSSSIMIVTTLQMWFEVEIVLEHYMPPPEDDGSINSDTLPFKIDIPETPRAHSPALRSQVRNILGYTLSEKKMKLLQDSIRVVRQTGPIPNPYIIYSLQSFENLCCATMHRTKKLLATGDTDSGVRLWNLSESKLPPKQSVCIPLGCDVETLVHIQQDNKHVALRGHSGPVNAVSFLPEADVLLSASHDCTMRAWRISDFTCAALYRSHNYPVWCIAVSPLGLYIATGSMDRTAVLWTLDRTGPIRVFAGHTADVNCVGFHPNNCYVATGSVDKTVRLWSVACSSLVRVFVGHTGSVQTLGISPNGKYLASAGDGGRVKIWDLAGGGALATLKGNNSRAIALDWSKCGSLVATASDDGRLQMWDVEKAIRLPDDPLAAEPVCQFASKCSQLLSLQFSTRNTSVLVGYNYPGENFVPPPPPVVIPPRVHTHNTFLYPPSEQNSTPSRHKPPSNTQVPSSAPVPSGTPVSSNTQAPSSTPVSSNAQAPSNTAVPSNTPVSSNIPVTSNTSVSSINPVPSNTTVPINRPPTSK